MHRLDDAEIHEGLPNNLRSDQAVANLSPSARAASKWALGISAALIAAAIALTTARASRQIEKRSPSASPLHRHARCHQERSNMDILFLLLTCGFFLLTWGFVSLCERV